MKYRKCTNFIIENPYFTSASIGTPFWSRALVILMVASTVAVVSQSRSCDVAAWTDPEMF